MPHYEIMTVASVNATSAGLINLLKKANAELVKSGGILRGVDHLGVRPLAYRMKAHGKYNEYGRYIRLRIQASPAALKQFEHRLRVDEQIIRWLTLRQKWVAPPVPTDDPLSASGKGRLFDSRGRTLPQHSDLDYYVARALLRAGKLTREQVAAMRKRYVEPETDEAFHHDIVDAKRLEKVDAARKVLEERDAALQQQMKEMKKQSKATLSKLAAEVVSRQMAKKAAQAV